MLYCQCSYSFLVRHLDQKPLAEAVDEPAIELYDFAKLERPPQTHLAFRALHEFLDEHQKPPNVHNVVRCICRASMTAPYDIPGQCIDLVVVMAAAVLLFTRPMRV